MYSVSWFIVGVILLFAFPIINAVCKWKRGKPLAPANIVGWISSCLPWLGLTLDAGASWREVRAFTIMAAITGVYFLLIHPRLFGHRERS
jgi:hypothetical protein